MFDAPGLQQARANLVNFGHPNATTEDAMLLFEVRHSIALLNELKAYMDAHDIPTSFFTEHVVFPAPPTPDE